VLAVLGFHAFPSYIRGGFIGVDIFFVISGYLISKHILYDLVNGQFSFLDFYCRRIRRIFPALILIFVCVLPFAWFVLTAFEFKNLGRDVAAGSIFISNFVFWTEAGYFDTTALEKPLLHLWSLAIEEQFYIFWPLLLWLAKGRRVQTTLAILLVVAISFLVNISTYASDAIANYYSPFSRMWELGAGGLLAWYELIQRNSLSGDAAATPLKLQRDGMRGSLLAKRDKLIRNCTSFFGILFIAIGILVIDKSRSFPGWWACLPVLGTIFLIASGPSAVICHSVLSWKLFVRLGLISYPLYLWHWVLLSFAFIVDPSHYDRQTRLGVVALSIVLAWCTYRFLELPIRKRRSSASRTFAMTGLMLSLGVLGTIVYVNSGFEGRSVAQRYTLITEAFNDWGYPNGLSAVPNNGAINYLSAKDIPPVIAFIGDSHIEQFGPLIVSLHSRGFPASIFITEAGCPPIPNVYEASHPMCTNYIDRIRKTLADYPSIKTVVIGGCWNCYFEIEAQSKPDHNNFNYYYNVNSENIYFRKGKGVAAAIDSLEHFLAALSSDYRVYLLLDNPHDKNNNPRNMIGNRLRLTELVDVGQPFRPSKSQLELNERLKAIAHLAGARVIDQFSSLCPGQECVRTTKEGIPVYKDDHHFRPFFVTTHINYFDFLNE
jgi:peptidoglycan/LPS O-acetylase OafA/YrhL